MNHIPMFPHFLETSDPTGFCPMCDRPLIAPKPGFDWRTRDGRGPLIRTQILICPEACAVVRVWYVGRIGAAIDAAVRELRSGMEESA